MQVELIGCTSAGKSTLMDAMADVAREEGITLHIGDDIALGQFGLHRIQTPWLRAFAVHAVAVVGCLLQVRNNLRFVGLSKRVLRRSGIPLFQRVNQFRKVLKQLGRFEMIRRRNTDEMIVLVDEGTVHTAHNLFVHVSCELDQTDLDAFASQVPLPDLVVYVSEREDVLVERVMRRGHPRISHPTRLVVERFVHQAVATFDQLSQHQRLRSRTVVLRGGHLGDDGKTQAPRLELLRRLIDKAIARNRKVTDNVAPLAANNLCSEMLS